MRAPVRDEDGYEAPDTPEAAASPQEPAGVRGGPTPTRTAREGIAVARRVQQIVPEGDLGEVWANPNGEPPHALMRDLDNRNA